MYLEGIYRSATAPTSPSPPSVYRDAGGEEPVGTAAETKIASGVAESPVASRSLWNSLERALCWFWFSMPPARLLGAVGRLGRSGPKAVGLGAMTSWAELE